MFDYCANHAREALANDSETITHMVYESVKIKADVVEADEREKGERRLLNFGHTFAHAIEKKSGILHGDAVAIGMVLAAKVSQQLGLISKSEADRIKEVVAAYQLPVTSEIPVQDLFDSMKQDKKREGGFIHLVLLEGIGKASYNFV